MFRYRLVLIFLSMYFCRLYPLSIPKNEVPLSVKSVKNNITKKRMRLLFVLGTFPWYTKMVIINQITGMLDRGHDIFIYAEKKPLQNFNIPELERYDLLNRTYYKELPPDLNQYDVIIFQYGDLASKYIHIKNQYNLNSKIVTFFRGGDITSCSKKKFGIYEELFKKGDIFLPICKYFKYRLDLLDCELKRTFVLYSGIDCKKFAYKKRVPFKKDGPIRIVSVNRLVQKKGLFFIVEAIHKLVELYPNIEYTIIGDGPKRFELEDQIKKLNLEDKVKLIGWLPQQDIINILHNSHIFLSASVTGKNGNQDAPVNVIKEAMLTGLPVVSTYHGGMLELVDNGISGWLVPERDQIGLVEKLSHLIKHPSKCIKMGLAGRKKVLSKFDMEDLNDQLEQLLLNLIEGKISTNE